MKKALVLGAGGFIGSHLVKRLKSLGYYVAAVDLKLPEFSVSKADIFMHEDLRITDNVRRIMNYQSYDEIYQMAADMGGWLHVFSGKHDADIVHNSALINLNVCKLASVLQSDAILFFASSACVYPMEKQTSAMPTIGLKESDAYPANPDSDYGLEKLFSERTYQAFSRNYGLNIRIARFHNIFGPQGTFFGGRQKAPADICRQVAEAADGGTISLCGDGNQQRSFLYIDECLDGVMKLMDKIYSYPLNIGSAEMVSINQLAEMVIGFSGKSITINYVETEWTGVRLRNSDNTLIKQVLDWEPSEPLAMGMKRTYDWINEMVSQKVN